MKTKHSFLSELIPFYQWLSRIQSWKAEFSAVFVGIILVIPQGIAFAGLTGVPVIHGIYASIWITMIASLWGSSIMMSGPNTAVSILIAVSVQPFAEPYSPEYIHYVMKVSFLAGCFQLLLWLTRSASFFQYLTPASIFGLSTGVGVLIIRSAASNLQWHSFASPMTAVLTVACGFFFIYRKSSYFIAFALIFGVLFSIVSSHLLGLNFTYLSPIELGFLDSKRAAAQFLSEFSIQALPAKLIFSSFLVAILSYSQSLVISQQLSLTTGFKTHLNKEAFAIALANTTAALFSAFAGSGSFNRTQANFEMKAQSPLAGFSTGLSVLIITLFAGEYFSYLPLAAISGVLFIVGIRLIKIEQIKKFSSQKTTALQFWTTLLSIFAFGLNYAILLSVFYATLNFITSQKSL